MKNLFLGKARASALAGSILATTVIVGGFSTAAHAQTAEGADAEDSARSDVIIVTARKREESLLESPFGISAFTDEDLADADVKDFTDLDDFTPGLTFENASAPRGDRGIPNIIIRGLNLATFSGSSEAALMFIDGAPVFGGEVGSFVDVQRVEVLRGPQSAYFGRNTFSGAINLITKDPGNEFGGSLSGEFGSFGTTDLQGSIEGPIVEDVISFRVAGRRTENGGHYINNANGLREIGDELTESLVGTLVITPVDAVKLKFRGSLTSINDGSSQTFRFPGTFANCDPDGNGSVTWLCGTPPGPEVVEPIIGFNDRDNFFADVIRPFSLFEPSNNVSRFDRGIFLKERGLAKRIRSFSGAATIDLPAGITLDWISSFHRDYTSIVTDENFLPRDTTFPGLSDTATVDRFSENSSHELRLTSDGNQKLRWTVGANYVEGDAIVVHSAVIFFAPTLFSSRPNLLTDTYGVFGGLYYDITDRLTISGELRYQEDKVAVPASGLETTFKDWGPRLTIEYQLNDDVNLFANYARGFRPGSFNTGLIDLTQGEFDQVTSQTGAGIDVDPETIEQFEFGVKGGFFNNRLRGSLVGYFGQITDQQVTALATFIDEVTMAPTPLSVLTNGGVIDLAGLELEASLEATDNLTLQSTFAWNHTSFQEGGCLTCVSRGSIADPEDILGNQLPGAPEFSGSFVGLYEMPLSDSVDGFIRGEYVFQSTKYGTEANLLETGSRHLVNLRVGVEFNSWRLEGYVTNLFNDDTYSFVAQNIDLDNFGNGFTVGLPDKRAFGVRASVNF